MKVQQGEIVASPLRRNTESPSPYRGEVIAPNDPRAWEGRAANLNSQLEIDRHVAWCEANGLLDAIPVIWDFGPGGKAVFWENRNALVAYESEVEAWLKARN